MATAIDSAALLTYRAAWLRDQGKNVTREAAMAKMTATENAQQIIDMAVQMHGGMGMTEELNIGHYFKRLTIIETLFGNVDFHLRRFGSL